MKRKIIVTEKQIKNLFKIIKEQVSSDSKYDYSDVKTLSFPYKLKDELSVNQKVIFQPGYHSRRYIDKSSLDSLITKLNELISKINLEDFKTKNRSIGDKFEFKIITSSSESQIPNLDREKPEGQQMIGPLDLAIKRKTTVDELVRDYLTSKLGPLTTSVNKNKEPYVTFSVVNKKPVIGPTPWSGSFFCPKDKDSRNYCVPIYRKGVKDGDPKFLDIKQKYDSEQNLTVDVQLQIKEMDEISSLPTIKPKITQNLDIKAPVPNFNFNPGCLRDMKIKINYETTGHFCNQSVYEVYINDILMKRDSDNAPYVSLNNAGLMDNAGNSITNVGGKKEIKSNDPKGKRYNTITIPNSLISQLNDNTGTLKIKITCRNLKYFGLDQKSFDNLLFTKVPNGKLSLNGNDGLYWDPSNQEWYHDRWKNGCHDSVGLIKVTNGLGKKANFTLTTPTKKNESIITAEFDPCSLAKV
jgi:hypothetical protein